MKKLIITAKNDKGVKAIKEHLKECYKLSLKDRLMFKTTFNQEVLNENPLTICLTCKSSFHNSNPFYMESIKHVANTVMKENGAKEEDYIIEVKNE